jgi:hypothetical protein
MDQGANKVNTTSADAERIAHADAMASMWINRGNEANEREQFGKAERHFEKAQKWLDRSNELRGFGSPPSSQETK